MDEVTKAAKALAATKPCVGRKCGAKGGEAHSVECYFDHWLAYSQITEQRELLELAFKAGFDAGQSEGGERPESPEWPGPTKADAEWKTEGLD